MTAAPRPRALLAVILFAAALAAFGALRASRASSVGGDFLRYHRAARLVATGRPELIYDADSQRRGDVYADERAAGGDPLPEREFKYAPSLAVLMAPLGLLPPRTAWIVWGAWNGALTALVFAAAWAHAGRGLSWTVALLPLGVLAHAANDNLNLGQLNLSAIAPTTVAFFALSRGRPAAAGALAAFGAVVKYLPALLVIWFATERAWRALVAFVAGVAVFGVAIPAAVLSPSGFADLTARWWELRHRVYTGLPESDLPGHSVKSFVYRVFGGTHYRTGSGADAIDWDVSLLRADPETLRIAVVAVVVVLLLAALLAARRLRPRGAWGDAAAAGTFTAWMVLASPEARSPHFLYLALPVTALAAALASSLRAGRRPRAALILAGVAAVLLNTSSESLFGRPVANGLAAVCALGWASILTVAALLASGADDDALAKTP